MLIYRHFCLTPIRLDVGFTIDNIAINLKVGMSWQHAQPQLKNSGFHRDPQSM
jgi:hypothetical protein